MIKWVIKKNGETVPFHSDKSGTLYTSYLCYIIVKAICDTYVKNNDTDTITREDIRTYTDIVLNKCGYSDEADVYNKYKNF